MIAAGKLRERITIQAPTVVKDANGDETMTWADFAANVPAQWLPGPGREYLASESLRAVVAGRFVIRKRPGITAKMRVLWEGQVWAIKAPPLPGGDELTLMVASDG